MLRRLLMGRASGPSAADAAKAHKRSMSARPLRAPRLRAEERDGGGLRVTVFLQRPRWQRVLGAPGTMERTFALDAVGRQVYEWCDGKTSVAALVARFAKDRQVHLAEAQAAVTMFLRTLAGKGLVVMEMDKKKK